mgnify:CR=1 FL=1
MWDRQSSPFAIGLPQGDLRNCARIHDEKAPAVATNCGAMHDQVPWSYFSPKDQVTSASPGVSGDVAVWVGREDAV